MGTGFFLESGEIRSRLLLLLLRAKDEREMRTTESGIFWTKGDDVTGLPNFGGYSHIIIHQLSTVSISSSGGTIPPSNVGERVRLTFSLSNYNQKIHLFQEKRGLLMMESFTVTTKSSAPLIFF